jgi:hypothetical protein
MSCSTERNSSGGYFSNTEDLLKFGSAILGNRVLSPVKTRKWLKPMAHTSSSGLDVGGPWEIFRSNTLTVDGRMVDVYTKTGDLGPYHGVLALVPDYDIVVNVLTGGPESDAGVAMVALSMTLKAIIPAVEQAGKVAAQSQISGLYTDAASNSKINLAVVEDGSGMAVTEWVIRGIDIMKNYGNYLGIGSTGAGPRPTTFLYPIGLSSGDKVSWRALFYTESLEQLAARESLLFYPQGSCVAWFRLDRVTYGLNSLDDFVFTTDSSGKVTEVTTRFFRVTMKLEARNETALPGSSISNPGSPSSPSTPSNTNGATKSSGSLTASVILIISAALVCSIF